MSRPRLHTSVILKQLLKLCPQREVDLFQLRQVKLPHLRLIGNRQRLDTATSPFFACFSPHRPISRIPLARHRSRSRTRIPRFASDSGILRALSAAEAPDQSRSSVPQTRFFLNLDHCLARKLTVISHPESKIWSGRRESNPRPTAWKAVTLPLSYSRSTRCQLSAVSSQRKPSMEPMTRIELVTSPLPRECSTN